MSKGQGDLWGKLSSQFDFPQMHVSHKYAPLIPMYSCMYLFAYLFTYLFSRQCGKGCNERKNVKENKDLKNNTASILKKDTVKWYLSIIIVSPYNENNIQLGFYKEEVLQFRLFQAPIQ